MSAPISKDLFDKIHRLAKENPTISNAEIARKIGISKDAVNKWRRRPTYSAATEDVSAQTEQHYYKRENQLLKKQITDLLDEQVKSNKLSEFTAELAAAPVKIPKWSASKPSATHDTAVPMILMSDWHLDEVVKLDQMSGVNEFNRKIADRRCGNFFDNSVRLAKHFVKGIKYDGLYLLMGGDIFSGNIHEELKTTNETTIIESLLYWVEPIASGIRYLADNFGAVHIPCVVGNHGRLSYKPVAKNRVQDNFDYLFYNMLAMTLKNDPRITWNISAAADCRFTVHNQTFLFTHGDQFRGGGGIAGAVHPWLLGNARKLKAYTGMGLSYDWMVMGHWHQLTLGIQGMIVNGSLKGYDEYAAISNFPYESPQQAFWLVQPKWGVTGRWPVHVLSDNEEYCL